MGLALRRLRHEWRRALATGLSVLVAVSAFVVLTGSAETARLRTTATVNANFRSSYDVLVRPKGSQTAIEKTSGKVRPNYLSGIFGGITTAQVDTVKRIPGVEVAAPIAMIGEVLQTVDYPVDVTSLVGSSGPAVLRFTVTDHDLHGLATAPASAGYVYVGNQLSLDLGADDLPVKDSLPGGRDVTVCSDMPASAQI